MTIGVVLLLQLDAQSLPSTPLSLTWAWTKAVRWLRWSTWMWLRSFMQSCVISTWTEEKILVREILSLSLVSCNDYAKSRNEST